MSGDAGWNINKRELSQIRMYVEFYKQKGLGMTINTWKLDIRVECGSLGRVQKCKGLD